MYTVAKWGRGGEIGMFYIVRNVAKNMQIVVMSASVALIKTNVLSPALQILNT
jgi:hypothetical protein